MALTSAAFVVAVMRLHGHNCIAIFLFMCYVFVLTNKDALFPETTEQSFPHV